MKLSIVVLPLVLMFASCSASIQSSTEEEKVIFQEKDQELTEEVVRQLQAESDSSKAALLLKTAIFFMETPYVAHTLERDTEMLVVNVREVDCTTFAENSLAMVNTLKSDNPSFDQFTDELQQIRYRDGKIEGYGSRLHYFSDWIWENDRKGLIKDVSKEIAETPYPNQVNFMSTHPDSYRQLKNNPDLVQEMAMQEKEISKRAYYYIPEDTLADVEHLLQEGDIAGITTSIEGLDISHVVLLVRKNGRIYPLHASSAAEKVILSDETLEEYLKSSKSATGIMVARPL